MFTYKHQDRDYRICFLCKYSSGLYNELIDAYVQQSRASLVGDQFLYSCDLNLGFRGYIM